VASEPIHLGVHRPEIAAQLGADGGDLPASSEVADFTRPSTFEIAARVLCGSGVSSLSQSISGGASARERRPAAS